MDVHTASKKFLCFALVCLLAWLPLCSAMALAPKKLWTLSARKINLKPHERIVAFQLNLESAWVNRICKMPNHWLIDISNAQDDVPRKGKKPPYWTTAVSGTTAGKDSGIKPDFFNEFVLLEKEERLPIKFDAELIIYASENLSTTRRSIVIPLRELLLAPVPDESTITSGMKVTVKQKISLHKTGLGADERIAGFTFRLRSADIRSFTGVPVGWKVSLSNEVKQTPLWTAEIKGRYGLGASRIGTEFLSDFGAEVEKLSGKKPFDVELVLDLEDRYVVIPKAGLRIQ